MEVNPTINKPIDKYVNSFTAKNLSAAANVTYTTAMIVMVLVAASYGGHSVNSKALQPNADTVFYRIDTTIRKLERQFWEQGLQEDYAKLLLSDERPLLQEENIIVCMGYCQDGTAGISARGEDMRCLFQLSSPWSYCTTKKTGCDCRKYIISTNLKNR